MRRYEALRIADDFVSRFKNNIQKATLVGSLVRDHPEVSDVDILIVGKKIYHGPPLNLFYVTENEWETGILHWAIGKAIIQIKAKAKAKGYKLTAHGLFRGHKVITTRLLQVCELLKITPPEVAIKVLGGKGRLI